MPATTPNKTAPAEKSSSQNFVGIIIMIAITGIISFFFSANSTSLYSNNNELQNQVTAVATALQNGISEARSVTVCIY